MSDNKQEAKSDGPKDNNAGLHGEALTALLTMASDPPKVYAKNNKLLELPADFQPGPFDVWCGRGRACKHNPGNLKYRQHIKDKLEEYKAAPSKLQKGSIISEIVNNVRKLAHDECVKQKKPKLGGFIKEIDGRWYDVGDFLAREKTSQCFRDALSTCYSSSAQSKYKRRRLAKLGQDPNGNPMVEEADGKPRSVSENTAANALSHLSSSSTKQQPSTTSGVSRRVSLPETHDPNDAVVVCGLQTANRPAKESPMDALNRVVEQIETINKTGNVDVFCLPELAPIGYSEDTFSKYLPNKEENKKLYQDIDRKFEETAKRLQVYICYGTIGVTNEGKLTIRQIVVDRSGKVMCLYDKTLLCDYGDCAETRYFATGPYSHSVSFPVTSKNGKVTMKFGLLICADMRYPQLSRQLTAANEHKVDCILQPCSFARDCSFRTWTSFMETRAVENSIYWIGVNYSGSNYGMTTIVPPFVDNDHEPIKLDCGEGHLIGSLSRKTLAETRAQMPFYRNLTLEELIKTPATEV